MYAYAHTPFDEETIELTSFSSGEKQFAFIWGFYGLKRVPKFFIKQMSSFFSKTLSEQGFVLVYIDDILSLSNSEEHMFQLIEQPHTISTEHNLKIASKKSFLLLLKVNFLGHEAFDRESKQYFNTCLRLTKPKKKSLKNYNL